MSDRQPQFIVCEDGDEYLQRFVRFLGRELAFVRTGSCADVERILDEAARDAIPPVGLLLDLDFRRAPLAALIDEEGRPPGAPERARLSAHQGILILRQLRRRGVTTPAVLFADLDDPAQSAFLAQTLAPLSVVDSRTGMGAIAALLRRLAGLPGAGPGL